VLVEVAGDDDAGRRAPQLVEQRAGARHLLVRVTAVEPDGPRPGAGDLDGVADPCSVS
jgi:hypothetical protein